MNRKQLIAMSLVCAGTYTVSVPTSATDAPYRPDAQSKAAPAQRDDARFFDELARANIAEIQAAELARTKATADAVKHYATRMIKEHQPMLDALRKLGQSKGLSVPTVPDAKQMATMKRLQQQTGETFDRSYMTAMVKDHKEVLALLQDIATEAKDPALQSTAKEAMPRIKTHLDEAMRIADDTTLPERVYSTPPKGK